MKKKIIYILCSMLMIITMVYAIIFRMSDNEEFNTESYMNAVVMGIDDDFWNDINISDEAFIEDMVASADVILLGTATDERTIRKNCILTKVAVVNILKGHTDRDFVNIYEPVDIVKTQQGEKIYFTSCGYILMQQGSAYILFLEEVEGETINYRIINQSVGKFPIVKPQDGFGLEYPSEFNLVQNYGILTNKDEVIVAYEHLRVQVIDKYYSKNV